MILRVLHRCCQEVGRSIDELAFMRYNQSVQSRRCTSISLPEISIDMNEHKIARHFPISTVRYGMGKEIQLYEHELVIESREEDKEIRLPLETIERLILTPGDPTPSKLVLIADLNDGSSVLLAEGMTNARDFREMLPRLTELCPTLQLDPPDMAEQLRQALNNKRAWSLTCYGAIILLCILLYSLYLLITFIGMHH